MSRPATPAPRGITFPISEGIMSPLAASTIAPPNSNPSIVMHNADSRPSEALRGRRVRRSGPVKKKTRFFILLLATRAESVDAYAPKGAFLSLNGLLALLLASALIASVGCTASGHVASYDSAQIPLKTDQHQHYLHGENILVHVGGDKTFSGRPSTFFGKIIVLNLDLERIQNECAKRVIGDSAIFTPAASSGYEMTTSITDFSYKIKNVGLIGQKAAVSFTLRISLKKNGEEVAHDSSDAVEYSPSEAEFKAWKDLFLGLIAVHMGKADKFAQSAFLATAMYVIARYETLLANAR